MRCVSELDLQVHYRLHFRAAEVAQNTASAERPRADLHSPLHPADHFFVVDVSGDQLAQFVFVGEMLIRRADGREKRFDLVCRCRRSQRGAVLCVMRLRRAGIAQQLMPDERGNAQRTAGVASDTRLTADVRTCLTGRARLRLTYLSPPLTIQSP